MKPSGAHTHGPQGGGLVLLVVVAALAIGSGAASRITDAIVSLLIIVGVVIVLAVAGVVALLVWRTRSERPGRPAAARPVYQLPPDPRPELEESHKPAAIEPRHENHFPAIGPGREVHYHFHVSAAELAAIMRHHAGEEQP